MCINTFFVRIYSNTLFTYATKLSAYKSFNQIEYYISSYYIMGIYLNESLQPLYNLTNLL